MKILQLDSPEGAPIVAMLLQDVAFLFTLGVVPASADVARVLLRGFTGKLAQYPVFAATPGDFIKKRLLRSDGAWSEGVVQPLVIWAPPFIVSKHPEFSGEVYHVQANDERYVLYSDAAGLMKYLDGKDPRVSGIICLSPDEAQHRIQGLGLGLSPVPVPSLVDEVLQDEVEGVGKAWSVQGLRVDIEDTIEEDSETD